VEFQSDSEVVQCAGQFAYGLQAAKDSHIQKGIVEFDSGVRILEARIASASAGEGGIRVGID
jgi:hypothetical protein